MADFVSRRFLTGKRSGAAGAAGRCPEPRAAERFAARTATQGDGANGHTESVQDNRGTTTIGYASGTDMPTTVTDPVTGAVGYTMDLIGDRRYMTLPGGGQWEYQYSTLYWSVNAEEPDKSRPLLVKLIDDQGRDVEYDFTLNGMLKEVRSDRTYDGQGVLTAQLVTDYTYDQGSGSGSSYSRGWLTQIKNSWSVKGMMGQWTNTTLAENDYTYSNGGNRLTKQVSGTIGGARSAMGS